MVNVGRGRREAENVGGGGGQVRGRGRDPGRYTVAKGGLGLRKAGGGGGLLEQTATSRQIYGSTEPYKIVLLTYICEFLQKNFTKWFIFVLFKLRLGRFLKSTVGSKLIVQRLILDPLKKNRTVDLSSRPLTF